MQVNTYIKDYLDTLRDNSRQTVFYSLKAFVKHFPSGETYIDKPEEYPFHRLTKDDFINFMENASKDCSPSTFNLYMTTLRRILQHGVQIKEIPREVLLAFNDAYDNARITKVPVTRNVLTQSDILRCLKHINNKPRTSRVLKDRNMLLFTLLIGTGLRSYEVLALDIEDLNRNDEGFIETITIRKKFKGAINIRKVPIPYFISHQIDRYLKNHRGNDKGALFSSQYGLNTKGRLPRLHKQTIHNLVKDLVKNCDIPKLRVSDLYHTWQFLFEEYYSTKTFKMLAGKINYQPNYLPNMILEVQSVTPDFIE